MHTDYHRVPLQAHVLDRLSKLCTDKIHQSPQENHRGIHTIDRYSVRRLPRIVLSSATSTAVSHTIDTRSFNHPTDSLHTHSNWSRHSGFIASLYLKYSYQQVFDVTQNNKFVAPWPLQKHILILCWITALGQTVGNDIYQIVLSFHSRYDIHTHYDVLTKHCVSPDQRANLQITKFVSILYHIHRT